jgi:hypothetical protein
MVGKENQTHRYTTVGHGSQDYGTDPQGSEPANYDGSHERPQCNNQFAKSSRENMKIGNLCTTLVTQHLG